MKVQPGGQPNVIPARSITLQPGQVWELDFPLTESGSGGSAVVYRASLLGDVGNFVNEEDETDNKATISFSFHKPCESILQEIDKLERRIVQIQSSPGYLQGPTDPHPGKPDPELLAEVKALQHEKEEKTAQFRACKLNEGGTCPSSTYAGVRENDHRWRNYIESVDIKVRSYWRPSSLEDLVYILQHAEARQQHVHAAGAGWSFEDLAATPDWMVDLRNLNRILTDLVDMQSVHEAVTEEWRARQLGTGDVKLVHVEAGARLFDLNNALFQRGLALPTMGGSQGQHLAGAISTSTHGSDLGQPPLCDLVQAVHLVTTGGRELWIEAASRPVTAADAALRTAISACPGLEIVRSDELLEAVRVGMGRFGVIYSVVLQVTNAFRLAEYGQELPWPSVANALVAGIDRPDGTELAELDLLLDAPPAALDADDAPLYLEILMNPRKSGSCWVRRRWATNTASDLNVAASTNPLCATGVSNALLLMVALELRKHSLWVVGIPFYGLVKAPLITARATELEVMALDPHLTGGAALAAALNAIWASQIENELSWLIDEANQLVLSGELESSMKEGRRGRSYHISAGQQDPASEGDCYRANSIEVVFGIGTRAYVDFINAVLAEAPRRLQAGYFVIRFTRRSQALLSMHNVDHPIACSIEIASLRGVAGNDDWMRWIEETALTRGGRPHWGQQNHLTHVQVERLYGRKLARWRLQLTRVVGASRTFSNHHSEQRGLEPARTTIARAAWIHGHRVQVEHPARVARTSRMDAHGVVEGKAGTETWLHLAIPTPVIVGDRRLVVDSVMLRYRAAGGAQVHAVHVYDGERRIAAYDDLTSSPTEWMFERFAVPERPYVRGGLGISIGVRFPAAETRIELAAGGADFLDFE